MTEYAFVAATSFVQVARNAPPFPAPDSQEGHGSQRYSTADFDFNAASKFLGARHEPK